MNNKGKKNGTDLGGNKAAVAGFFCAACSDFTDTRGETVTVNQVICVGRVPQPAA